MYSLTQEPDSPGQAGSYHKRQREHTQYYLTSQTKGRMHSALQGSIMKPISALQIINATEVRQQHTLYLFSCPPLADYTLITVDLNVGSTGPKQLDRLLNSHNEINFQTPKGRCHIDSYRQLYMNNPDTCLLARTKQMRAKV